GKSSCFAATPAAACFSEPRTSIPTCRRRFFPEQFLPTQPPATRTPMIELFRQPAILGGVALLAVFVILASVLSRFYVRASKEQAFVRTGFGGQKVIADGGAIVFPI